MKFIYKIQKPDGTFEEGRREAPSREALLDNLRAEEMPVVWVKEAPQRVVVARIRDLFSFSFVPLREKVAFAKNLGAMLAAGLSLARALEVLARQSGSRAFQSVLVSVGERVRKGGTLSDALRAHPRVFPPLFSAVVTAGEESGSLAASFSSLAQQLERVYALGRRLRGALIYPALIVLVMCAIGILMLLYVVPELSATFMEFGVELPLATRAILVVSALLTNHLLVFISSALLVAAVCVIFFRTRFGGRLIDVAVLHIPSFRRIAIDVNSARTARILGSLSSSGVPIVVALEVASSVVQNSYYRDALLRARGEVERGQTLSSAFSGAGTLYEPYFSEMITSGEETGKLGEMLQEAASFYEAEVEQKTKNISAFIEPFLMVAVGIAVGYFAYAMILPMYTLMNSV